MAYFGNADINGHIADLNNPHTTDKTDVGLGNVENLKVNLSASAAPTTGDDSGDGYAVGSRWVDTTADKEYVCVDASAAAAVWVETTQGGSTNLDDLGDVVITGTPADDELLAYDSGSGDWINQTAAEAGLQTTLTANEIVDHSSVTITAGVGLSGGGDITTSRTLDLDIDGIGGAAVFASADKIAVYDDSAGQIAYTTVGTLQSNLDHDLFAGFVANEHVDHSSVSITAGNGLSGGGDLTTTRTIDLDIRGQLALLSSPVLGDSIAVADASAADVVKYSTLTSINAIMVHDDLVGFVANEHTDHSGVTLTAGEGLTGGGDITTSRTFALDINGLTAESTVDGAADYIVMYDATASAHRKVLIDDLPSSGGGIAAVVDDTTPQLGGDLDVNGNDIVSVSNGDINILPNGSGQVLVNTVGFSDASVQTTDATQTTLQTIAIPTDDERVVSIRARGHEDATDDSFWYVSTAGFKNVGGTVSIIGAESVSSGNDAGASAWDVSMNVSGANVLVQVTGEAAHTIDWVTSTEVS